MENARSIEEKNTESSDSLNAAHFNKTFCRQIFGLFDRR